MNISKKEKFILFLAIISFILLVIVFKWIRYLSVNDYIFYSHGPLNKEGFGNAYISDGYTGNQQTNTVNLPLNTKYSCKNMCGPTSRCSISGQQCLADIDCPGCQPYSPPLSKSATTNTPGDNDSGKLTVGVTPDYSSLTSGYGTKERIITKDLYGQPAQANFGYDTWGSTFNEGQVLFNKRYKPNQLPYMPNYPPMYSITGEFIGDGPLPSNY